MNTYEAFLIGMPEGSSHNGCPVPIGPMTAAGAMELAIALMQMDCDVTVRLQVEGYGSQLELKPWP